jgi:hypothetical protein
MPPRRQRPKHCAASSKGCIRVSGSTTPGCPGWQRTRPSVFSRRKARMQGTSCSVYYEGYALHLDLIDPKTNDSF